MKLNKLSHYIQICVLLFLPVLLLNGCAYTFNPGTTGDARTLSIANIQNVSGNGPPNMSQFVTEKLKTFYQQNSNLSLVNVNGDWSIKGEIIGYQITPIAPQENQMAASNRLTITVNIVFDNYRQPKNSFKQAFSYYADYQQTVLLSAIQNELMEEIFDQIVLDIYTKTTSDW